ncbi:hypothetical protein P879_11417 [Paragonimus westermani]|uniref:Uncharacterized protein n=1 Tax=Paragonimus westermani TaxID=34504 RepID=A0A8T0DAU0_9TREM|nr:hypothetical protein P879_11417 [Paragonimus westermani]
MNTGRILSREWKFERISTIVNLCSVSFCLHRQFVLLRTQFCPYFVFLLKQRKTWSGKAN